MSGDAIPSFLRPLLWDVEPGSIDLDRDRDFVLGRVMARGSWSAMRWLVERYGRATIAEFLRTPRAAQLAPRDLAYWSLIAGVDVSAPPGGGRPAWAGG